VAKVNGWLMEIQSKIEGNMTVTVDDLSKLKYFAGVEMGRLAGLPQLFSKKSFIKGQTVVSEGDSQKNLHFVNSGVV